MSNLFVIAGLAAGAITVLTVGSVATLLWLAYRSQQRASRTGTRGAYASRLMSTSSTDPQAAQDHAAPGYQATFDSCSSSWDSSSGTPSSDSWSSSSNSDSGGGISSAGADSTS